MVLSVVIPARNEAQHLPRTVEVVHQTLANAKIPHHLIVVDDHSTDDTFRVAARLADHYPLSVVQNPLEAGKGAALRTGFGLSAGDVVAFIDADLEFPAYSLIPMTRLMVHNAFRTVVIGSRSKDHRPLSERLSSRLSHWLIRHLTRLEVHDTQAGIKMFPGWLARELSARAQETGWLFDVEALWMARDFGLPIAELAVTQRPCRKRRAGIRDFVESGRALIRLARRRRTAAWVAVPLPRSYALGTANASDLPQVP